MTIRHCSFLLSSLSAVAAVALLGACEPPVLKVPGAQLSGSVVIDAALKPLLPPPAGQAGTIHQEIEPNTLVALEEDNIGLVPADGPPLIIKATINGATCSATNDCRDIFEIFVDKDASLAITITP